MKLDLQNVDKIWQMVGESLRLSLSEATFNAYLRPSELLNIVDSGDKLICEIGCPSSFLKNTIDLRYSGQIRQELKRVLERDCEVRLAVKTHSEKASSIKTEDGPLFGIKTVPTDVFKKANLRADYTFENYAVGGSNQMAYAAAQAVAKKPGLAYNPLFIYGGVGVGKTHLMQSIGHVVAGTQNGGVLFCTGEEFTNDLVEAIRFKTTDKVRAKYRKLKLLMIDDVQFIAGKPTIQEEFFHTFNSIQKEGGQVVMTSDRPPTEIAKLEERLRSRFGAGLIVDIGPADFELRTAILLIKAKQKEMDLTMELAQLIATNIEGVRELEGFLVKLKTETEIRGKPINQETVEEALKISAKASGTAVVVTPSEVISQVGSFFGISPQQIKGERRSKLVVWPRQITMFLLRYDLRLPFEEVGRLIGGRDHSTVMHGADKIQLEMENNEALKIQLKEIRKRIFSISPNGG